MDQPGPFRPNDDDFFDAVTDDLIRNCEHHTYRLNLVNILLAQEPLALDLQHEVWSIGNPRSLRFDKQLMITSLEVNRTVIKVSVSYQFLGGVNEDGQRRFFRALENIPTLTALCIGAGLPGEHGGNRRIRLPVLLESLPRLVNRLRNLIIHQVVFSDQSEVERLADAVGAHGESLQFLTLHNYAIRVDENRAGFLDPILHAMRGRLQPAIFSLGGNGPNLVTVEALRLYLLSAVEFNSENQRRLGLHNVGLGDDHCKVVADLLVQNDRAPDGEFGTLELDRNPGIGQQGYEAILGLLNRSHWIEKVCVDDKSWEAKFDLVAEMSKHGRFEFLRGGAFDSQVDWVNWLDRITGLGEDDGVDDARRLSFLWYTLIEKPEFVSR
jgi:hypothetical protein